MLDQYYVQSSKEDNPVDESVEILQISTDLEYCFCPRWSGSVTLNYLDIHQQVEGSGVSRRERGIGDTVLLAHYNVPLGGGGGVDTEADQHAPSGDAGSETSSAYRFLLSFGTTLPTGTPRLPEDNPGGVPFSSLQTGSGTFNPVVGGHLRGDWGTVAASLEAAVVFPFYENRYGFQTGAYQTLRLNGELASVSQLRFIMGVGVEHRSPDQIDGQDALAGGGWRALVYPRILGSPWRSTSVFVGAQIPVYRNFDTHQLDSLVKWEVGFSVGF